MLADLIRKVGFEPVRVYALIEALVLFGAYHYDLPVEVVLPVVAALLVGSEAARRQVITKRHAAEVLAGADDYDTYEELTA